MSASSPLLSVGCPACGERLGVRAADVGRRAQCRACGKVFRLVGEKAVGVGEAKTQAGGAKPQGAGDVAADIVQELTPALHPVVCDLCQTLMYATDEQVGKKLKCPDCGRATLATARPPVRPRASVLVPDGDEYQLDEASAPEPRPVFRPLELRGVEWKREGDREAVAKTPATAGLRQPEGVERGAAPLVAEATQSLRGGAKPRACGPLWAMLLTSEVLVRWVMLSISLTAAGWFLSWVLGAMGAQVFVALPMYAIGCVLGGFWLLAALPVALALVTESSEGNDRLHDPPQFISFDFAEAFFVAIAAAVAMFPAWLTFKIPTTWPVEGHVALAAAAWLACFPIVLLSNLEQSSVFAVFSPRLGSSVVHCAGPWALFYVESLALAAAFGGLASVLLDGPASLMLILPWLAVAALFLYMRLLGRLAWWLAETMPAPFDADRE